MITFNDKQQEFIKMMRARKPIENTSGASKTECVAGEIADDELMALLEKKFDELFGPIDEED